MQVRAVNAGSSGLKLRLLNGRDQVVKTADLPECGPVTCHLGERGDPGPGLLARSGGEPERRFR
jgi:hypothetical protein